MEKILIKMRGFELGGVERLVIDIINNLELKNKKIVLITEGKDNFFKNQLKKEVEIVYVKPEKVYEYLEYFDKKRKKNIFFKLAYSLTNSYKKYKFAKNINDYIKKNKVRMFIDYTGTAMKYVSKIKVKNKVYWRHGALNEDEIKRKKKFGKYLNDYDKIILICEEMEEQFKKNFSKVAFKMKKIYNFIDEKKIDAHLVENKELQEILSKENYCVSVGRLSEEKDYETTIKAFKILKERGIEEKLFIIGDGDLKEKLNDIIKREELDESVFLLGAKHNPYIYMKHADLFLHSSKTEGFCLVIAEAMYVGTPIITSNFKVGAYELIEKEKNGEIFEIGDYEEFANKIEKLLKDKKLRKNYVEKSKKFVERFYIEKIMNEYRNLIINLEK